VPAGVVPFPRARIFEFATGAPNLRIFVPTFSGLPMAGSGIRENDVDTARFLSPATITVCLSSAGTNCWAYQS
jgi:hypothetical protein